MSSRTKRFIFAISLLLNIFLMSWATSHWIKYRVFYNSLLSGVMYTIPKEARPLFRENLQANRDELIQALRKLRNGRGQIREIFMQAEPDQQQLDEALKQVRDNLNITVNLLQDSLTRTMQDLPPEVRREWAQQWYQGNTLFDNGIERLSKELDK